MSKVQHLLSSTLSLICTDKRAANGTGYLQRKESGGGLGGLSGQKIKELAFHIRSLLPQTLTTQQTVPKTCSAHCYGFLSLYILCTFYFFYFFPPIPFSMCFLYFSTKLTSLTGSCLLFPSFSDSPGNISSQARNI